MTRRARARRSSRAAAACRSPGTTSRARPSTICSASSGSTTFAPVTSTFASLLRARDLGDRTVEAERGADPAELVAGDRLAGAAAADDDREVGVPVEHPPADVLAERRVVDDLARRRAQPGRRPRGPAPASHAISRSFSATPLWSAVIAIRMRSPIRTLRPRSVIGITVLPFDQYANFSSASLVLVRRGPACRASLNGGGGLMRSVRSKRSTARWRSRRGALPASSARRSRRRRAGATSRRTRSRRRSPKIKGLKPDARTAKLLELAKAEGGQVNVYSSLSSTVVKPLQDAWAAEYPDVKLNLYRASSEDVSNRFLSESAQARRAPTSSRRTARRC